MNEKNSIKELEDRARNTKNLVDRLNRAYYGMTWEEYIRIIGNKEAKEYETENKGTAGNTD